MAHPHWPLFDLRVRTPTVELRYPDDDDVTALATLAGEGVHPPEEMPFAFPWTDAASPQLERSTMQHFWRCRATWTPNEWRLPLAVARHGELMGVQDVKATKFGITRAVETGSWLGRRFQGQGVGKEMRAPILHLPFAGLGAVVASSGAWDDNPTSRAVSASLEYEANGDRLMERRGASARMLELKLERSTWEQQRRDDITIEGLEACLELFGAPIADG